MHTSVDSSPIYIVNIINFFCPEGKHRVPQITRKAMACRRALHVFSLSSSILTMIILLARPISSDLSLLLPLPFLAALGTLPVFTPTYVFFLEIFGIARILSTAHPFASRTSSATNVSQVSNVNSRSLYWRYALNAVFSRLFKNEKTRHIREILTRVILFSCSWGRGKKVEGTFVGEMDSEEGLIRIPPAGTFLLEKVGVVTALTIVDDELACESHSTPQQLLIPSGNGLKLLDLCPNFGDEVEIDSVDESRSIAKNKNRARSFGDSSPDSDSDKSEENEIYQHTLAPQRTLHKLRRQYKKAATALSSKKNFSRPGRFRAYDKFLEENEVQFEVCAQVFHYVHYCSIKSIGHLHVPKYTYSQLIYFPIFLPGPGLVAIPSLPEMYRTCMCVDGI